MSPVYDNMENLGITDETEVVLRYEGTADCFLMNEDEVETAISDTDVIDTVANLLATPGLDLGTAWHENVLESLRDEGLLDEYERDGTFVEYLTEILADNFYDHEIIDSTIEKYDHKRGACTLSAEFRTTAENLLAIRPPLVGWSATINGTAGSITLEG
tara:strand:+ start:595 stop:1071 length:477 start_codon:yes stop_codon:yes gene_type:complete